MNTARPSLVHSPRALALPARLPSRLPPCPALRGRQRGIVLIVALVLLLLITLLGVTSVRMLTVEERMAGNAFDRNLQFQAAETALREGEARALAQSQLNPPNTGFGSSCASGLCPTAAPGNPHWDNPSIVWQNASAAVSPLAGGAPQFIVEHLGSDFPCNPRQPTENLTCERYRVTARSAAPDGRATVILESIFAAD